MTMVATLFALGLVATNVMWPAAFGVFVAIGGVVGALMVVYEVRLTKRLAQAEFIRDLQTGFSSDANIGELWRKLLLKEEVTIAERPLVSSYLTFFETLHLLLQRGALDLALTDDLFRNRFFTAIGNRGVLETALVKEAGSFANVHNLIATWHRYLVANEIPMHPGYYGYVRALAEAKGYEIVRLHEQDLADLEDLQDGVLRTMTDAAWLRANSDVMLKECLVSHTALGARKDGELVAAAVLYDGGESDESIKRYFSDDPAQLSQSINLKLVLTLPSHRHKGLARTLVELLEEQAAELGKAEIMCTIHPRNKPSESMFKLLGYAKEGTVSTSYGTRSVFARKLPVPNKRWAR
jgi:GNAT superfamily N-acetyltransferase